MAEFSDAMKQVFDEIAKQFGILIDWTADNVVPYIADLIERFQLYLIFTEAAVVLLGIAATAIGTIMAVKNSKKLLKADQDETLINTETKFVLTILLLIFGAVIAIIGFIHAIVNLDDLFLAIFIPEIPIIELLRGYSNGMPGI